MSLNYQKYNSMLLKCKSWNNVINEIQSFNNTKDIGNLFEIINKYYLLLHPEYNLILEEVWLLNEVPKDIKEYLNLPNTDEGIDLIAKTKRGTYWAIQSKYLSDTTKSINRKYVSTFTDLSFNICKNIEFALVCTTASKSSRKFDLLYSNIGFLYNNTWQDLEDEFFSRLHKYLDNKDVSFKPFKPRKHQVKVLKDTEIYFKDSDNTRGKIIMPTGTGKSLTGFWIFQKLNVSKILICVPSLALVKQMIEVWARESQANKMDISWIAICSDESVEPDSVVGSTQELGVFVETDIEKIADQLINYKSEKLIVFTTYQSSKVAAQASKLANITYDLGIYDEAHKTVGRKGRLFSYLLDNENIKVDKRIFMTATERRFQGSSDDILSMDDSSIYGDDIHVMSFKDAIEFNPPILSDYAIVTINVTSSEIQQLIEENQFIFPEKRDWDIEVQSEMLASMIALRKAMQKYPIKHTVSFHGSIAKASKFEEFQNILTNSYKNEFGELDTFHVKGAYSTAKRKEILNDFSTSERSLVTNARCLTEGVDVPSIDGILFADPKKSTVDIVQAIGRALRLADGKEKGYVIIPVIIENEKIKETSYESILYLLRALASQDERIIDYYRYKNSSKKFKSNIEIDIDIPETISIDGNKFIDSLDTKIWNKLAKLSWMPFEEAREFVCNLKLNNNKEWVIYCKNKNLNIMPYDLPKHPNDVYKNKGWNGWGDWLGTGRIATSQKKFLIFEDAKRFVHKLNLKNEKEWNEYCRSGNKPDDIPYKPSRTYKEKGWIGLGDWLGTGTIAMQNIVYMDFENAKRFVHKLNLKTSVDWLDYCKGKFPNLPKKPSSIPMNVDKVYKKTGWINMGDWLGTGKIGNKDREFKCFENARKFVQSLNLKSQTEWKKYCKGEFKHLIKKPQDIPFCPDRTYKDKGWKGYGDWLGTKNIAPSEINFLNYKEARNFVRKLNLNSHIDWVKFCSGLYPEKGLRPNNIPSNPQLTYKNAGWMGYGDWLGTGKISTNNLKYRAFKEAKEFVKSLNLKSSVEWKKYCKEELEFLLPKPFDIPSNPNRTYNNKGWINWADWLGKEQ